MKINEIIKQNDNKDSVNSQEPQASLKNHHKRNCSKD